MLLWLYQYLHQCSKWPGFPTEPVQPIVRPALSLSINEQFNLEQRQDLSSTGPGTVSELPVTARLYLHRSSAAQTTSLFMFLAFSHFLPFFPRVSVQPGSFFTCVKLSVNHSLRRGLCAILYEQRGFYCCRYTVFIRGGAALQAEIMSVAVLTQKKGKKTWVSLCQGWKSWLTGSMEKCQLTGFYSSLQGLAVIYTNTVKQRTWTSVRAQVS